MLWETNWFAVLSTRRYFAKYNTSRLSAEPSAQSVHSSPHCLQSSLTQLASLVKTLRMLCATPTTPCQKDVMSTVYKFESSFLWIRACSRTFPWHQIKSDPLTEVHCNLGPGNGFSGILRNFRPGIGTWRKLF